MCRMQNKYGIQMLVVRNVPIMKKIKLKIHSKKYKRIIYQGAVNKDRGVDLMIKSMSYIDNAKLYIVGGGDLINEMMELVTMLKLEDKVVFLGQVHFNELFDITRGCDLGLSFESDTCFAYKFSLPNKIFDYINAELPILISDLPEFKNIIKHYELGAVLVHRDPKLVAVQVQKILSVPKDKWMLAINKAKKELCWNREGGKILSLFN